jgi:hypothetical protein
LFRILGGISVEETAIEKIENILGMKLTLNEFDYLMDFIFRFCIGLGELDLSSF